MSYKGDMVTKAKAWDALMQMPPGIEGKLERLSRIEFCASELLWDVRHSAGMAPGGSKRIAVSEDLLTDLCESVGLDPKRMLP